MVNEVGGGKRGSCFYPFRSFMSVGKREGALTNDAKLELKEGGTSPSSIG